MLILLFNIVNDLMLCCIELMKEEDCFFGHCDCHRAILSILTIYI